VFFYRFLGPLACIGGNLPTAPLGGLQERKHFGAMQNLDCDRSSRRFWNQMMPTGTVTSFNWSKGYGFIKTEGGADILTISPRVRTAGFRDLRKGRKVSFEIFDNQGKSAAKNLHLSEPADDHSRHDLNLAEMEPEITWCNRRRKDGTIGKKAHMDCARRSGNSLWRRPSGEATHGVRVSSKLLLSASFPDRPTAPIGPSNA
jgi:CspA family cold shock protein